MANRELLARLDPTDFDTDLAGVVARMQTVTTGSEVGEIDRWLDNWCGVQRSKGQKIVDAALERLRSDALIRTAGRDDKLAQVQLRMERLREEKRISDEARRKAAAAAVPQTVPAGSVRPGDGVGG